jgi:uncharacterized protein YqgC (DUF456 family)
VTPLEAVLGLVMLVGVVGIFVPVLPGSVIVWAAIVVWAVAGQGSPIARWGVAAAATALIGVALVVSTTLPARSAGVGAPRYLPWVVALGTIVGFFVVPVVGGFVGGPIAAFAAETVRLRDAREGWRSAVRTLKALGVGLLVELAAALIVIALWLAVVIAG